MEAIKYVTITEREYLSLRKKHNKYMQFLDTLNKKIDEADKLEERIDKAIEPIEELYKMVKEQDSDNINLIDRLEIILNILKGEENESN